jgi:hypothetical protein
VCPCLRISADRHHGPTHHQPLHLIIRVSKYMRFSVPNIPAAVLSKAAQRKSQSVSSPEAIQRIASFLSSGHAAVLTGAGVSVDSGLKAYRGKDGRYTNPDYKCAHHLTHHVPHSLSLTWTYLRYVRCRLDYQADFCGQSIVCSCRSSITLTVVYVT